jgi:glycosyltransferase involved in cell wall biosynthesis
MAIHTARGLSTIPHWDITLVHESAIYHKRMEDLSTGLRVVAIPKENKDELRNFLRNIHIDLLHLFDLTDDLFTDVTLELAQDKDVPIIVTPASDVTLWGFSRAASEILNKAKRIVVLTETEKRTLIEMFKFPENRVNLLPPAPCLAQNYQTNFRLKHHIPSSSPLILFLGRKIVTKGYQLILEAIPYVTKRYPDARFVFIGPDTDESHSVFSKYRMHPNVHCFGMVDDEEKTAALLDCDMLCLPSTVDVFPLVCLEAWAAKKAVIVSKMTGAKDVVREEVDGLIADPNPVSIAQAINALIANPLLRDHLGNNGYRRVNDHHSWVSISEEMSNIYAQELKVGR